MALLWLSPEVSASYPTVPLHLFLHTVQSSTLGETDVVRRPPPSGLFPMKTAGLYHLGSKGLDGGYPTLHQISRKAFPLLLPRVFTRMRLHFFFLLEPLERMSDEAEIRDVQNSQTCPVKSEPLQRDGPSAGKQTGPRRALDGVWPPKIRPSSAFLLIRSSSAFPPTPHSSSTPSFLLS